jgi:excisionase family DNA binding protein
MSGLDGWISTAQAAQLSGYADAHIRTLARRGYIEAEQIGRDWLIRRDDMLAYKARMDALGSQRHNPWRSDLAEDGRGRTR